MKNKPPPAPPVALVASPLPPVLQRRRLPDERKGVTRKLSFKHAKESPEGSPVIEEIDIYVTVGLYEDGTPGEVFLKTGKMGSAVSGLLDALAVSISIGLQSGVSLQSYTTKMKGMHFEPSGVSADQELRYAASVVDIVARWLEKRFPQESTT